MQENITVSKQLFERAKKRIPGGVNSPVRAFGAVGGTPRFIRRAFGSHIFDVDGNAYIDYVCSYGPGILGHAHPRVLEAVKRACMDGLSYGTPTEREVELAERIAEMVPSMEVSRLVNSGTEAVMSAIRVARGFTGRDKIVKFSGCYHGHSDGLLVRAGSAAMTTAVPDSAGVPAGYTDYTLLAEYNNPASVEDIFRKNKGEIAAVIAEPIAANMGVVLPEDGFLEFLREITEQYGALLIFDEVITGFRLALGGAQEYFDVKPDLTVLGKIVGGGMPIGAYGGRKEIMDLVSPAGPVYQAGTLSGNPVATAAGLGTLQVLCDMPEIYGRLEKRAERIADRARRAGRGRVQVNQIGSLIGLFFTDGPVVSYETALLADTERYAGFFHFMLSHGVYLAPGQFEAMFVSDAHTDEDIDRTCEYIEQFMNG